MRFAVLFLIFVVVIPDLFAQIFRVERIGTEQGLSQGSVYAMLKDSRGFLWFGTQDGLNRYDGHNFKVYYSDPDQPRGLHGSFVNSMLEAPNGDLWIGTDYGLNLYRRQSDDFVYFPTKNAKTPEACTPFAVDQQFVWYWSEEEGILKMDYVKKKKQLILAGVSHNLGLLAVSNATKFGKDGKLWVCLSKGLMQFDTATRETRYFFSNHPQNQLGNATTVLKALHAQDGLVYLSHSLGITVFNPQLNIFKNFTNLNQIDLREVYDLAEAPDGDIWIATGGNGLLRYSKEGNVQQFLHKKNDSNSLSNNTITTVYVSNDGLVWANPDPLGINLLVASGNKFRSIKYVSEAPNALNDPNVRTLLAVDKTHLWVGTEQGGINVWNKQSGQIEDYITHHPSKDKSIPSQSIYHLLRDQQGQIWVATYNGLSRYTGGGHNFENFFLTKPQNIGENIIRCLSEWDPNHLLVGTENGLYIFDKIRKTFIQVKGLEGVNILWVDCTDDGKIWLTRFNESAWKGTIHENQWRAEECILSGGNALSLLKDLRRKCYWIATNVGLLQYKNGKVMQKFSTKDGLGNAYVYGLLLDQQQNIWLSTNRGLSSFNPESKKFRNYQMNDGLQGYEFNNRSYLVDNEGYFYFGGTNGFTFFRPSEVRTNTFQPQIQLTELEINDQPANIGSYIGETKSLILPFDQNTLSLSYVALDYLSNGKNRYQYRLVGLEDAWHETENAFVRYVRVPHGQYVFEVKAANGDGFWSDAIYRLNLTIAPPFWQTWWFILINVVGVAALGMVLFRLRIRQLELRQRERLDLVVRTQEAERKQLATELHDDLGMRLSTLQMYLSEIDMVQNSRVSKLRPILEDAIMDIRNLLQDLNPKLLFEYGLRVAVEDLGEKLNVMDTLRFELLWFDFPEKLPEAIEINLFRIVQELVSNTLKHAKANSITLQFLQRDDQWVILYEDNGCGFEMKPFSSGFGLQNIENRVRLLKGNLYFDTAPLKGVHATIEIPYQKNANL
ncbi:sensor histidine kinase [Runella salmonicolor]|uniref:ATP-binding protein n=1 Tax=Runella salmonicolor TaxID=2950278 RepID=A0ABT1FRY5_9BACT|nr:sensor histidine kinase [Runella salmonicolor]MCP1384494.1 ATP-binding protein [Runella salmonicolor]